MIKFPNAPTGNNRIAAWLRRLLQLITLNQVVSIEGYRVAETQKGKVFTLIDSGNGQKVYFRACLADGTECYVPLRVSGVIYKGKGTSTITPEIDSGDVPSDQTLLN